MLAFRKLERKVRLQILQCSRPRPLATAVLLYTILLDCLCEFVFVTAYDKLQRRQLLS